MQDAWRAYLELALGLTEASRRKAQQVVKDVVGKGEATAAQLQVATGDLIATSKANQEAMARLIRYEVDRALGAMGLATSEEVTDLSARVQDLERRVRRAEEAPAPQSPQQTAAKKTAAKKTAKKAPAKKTGGQKSTVKKSTAKKSSGAAKKSAGTAKQTA